MGGSGGFGGPAGPRRFQLNLPCRPFVITNPTAGSTLSGRQQHRGECHAVSPAGSGHERQSLSRHDVTRRRLIAPPYNFVVSNAPPGSNPSMPWPSTALGRLELPPWCACWWRTSASPLHPRWRIPMLSRRAPTGRRVRCFAQWHHYERGFLFGWTFPGQRQHGSVHCRVEQRGRRFSSVDRDGAG